MAKGAQTSNANASNQANALNQQNKIFFEDIGSPFHLQNEDHPGLILVSHSITGARKIKLGFVDGHILQPSIEDLLFGVWIRCNSMAFLFVLVRPLSKNTYRRLHQKIIELLWLEAIWLLDWWANMKVELYADQETFELLGKEHALLICNHKSDIDWLVGWVLAQSGFAGLNDFPMSFWLALFVEGTRFTEAKLLAAQDYAMSAGLPVPRNVLIPRTKGFVAAVTHLRSFVPAIYNITVTIPQSEPRPTLLRIFRGRSSLVHVHIERHLMQELPETGGGISQWCKDMWVAKDALLERHLAKDTFGENIRHDIGRPKKSLLVVVFWSCILILTAVTIFQWCPFSWAEVAACAVFLALITILMQIFILVSQSEYSDPPKVQQPDPLTQTLLQS